MVKKLVRLALASEYSRTPVRRADITAKGNPNPQALGSNQPLNLHSISHGAQHRPAIQARLRQRATAPARRLWDGIDRVAPKRKDYCRSETRYGCVYTFARSAKLIHVSSSCPASWHPRQRFIFKGLRPHIYTSPLLPHTCYLDSFTYTYRLG